MNQNETMGRRIAALRKQKNLTQDALAQELGVSPQAVSKWEHDLSCPDISILPGLARVLGVSTDYLLGGGEAPVFEAEIVDDPSGDDRPGIHVESSGDNHFDIRFDPPKRYSFSGAAWLIVTALLMLAGPVFRNNNWSSLGFWSACGISLLLVWGVGGMIRRVKVTNVLMTLAGVYLALSGLNIFQMSLGWEILFPGLILILGLCLLLEGMRKKRRRSTGIHITGPDGFRQSNLYVKDGYLYCSGAFSENRYNVQTGELKGGEVSVSFGEHVLDFSGVEKVGENCRIDVSSSFGELCLRIPSRYQAEMAVSKSFAECSVQGRPDPNPEGIIRINANVSFGELTVKYI